MSFFEPIPEPDPPEPEEPPVEEPWVEPEWIGPPEHIVGGVVPFRTALFSDDRVSIRVDRVLAYPTGLFLSLELRVVDRVMGDKVLTPMFPWGLVEDIDGPWGRHIHELQPAPDDYLRFGVRYTDGRQVATSTAEEYRSVHSRRLDDPPPADELLLIPRGGSGGRNQCSHETWLWPGPSEGDVDLVIAWPALDVPETSVMIPAAAIEAGRADISPLWS